MNGKRGPKPKKYSVGRLIESLERTTSAEKTASELSMSRTRVYQLMSRLGISIETYHVVRIPESLRMSVKS
jgi:hypothetical protein